LNLYKSFTDNETRVLWAAIGKDLVILACTVFDWSTHVKDGQTELQWLKCATAVPAFARKKQYFCSLMSDRYINQKWMMQSILLI